MSHQNHPDSTAQDASGSLKEPQGCHQGIFRQLWKQSIWIYISQTLERECTNLEGQQRRSLSIKKRNAIQHLHEEPDLWNNLPWTDESKVEMLGEKLRTKEDHGGGSVVVWGCFAASRPRKLAIITLTILYEFHIKP